MKPLESYDVAARQADITSKPPRLAPLQPEEFGPEASAIMERLRDALKLPRYQKDVPDFIATTFRTPEVMEGHFQVALGLFRGALTVRDRELAVLRTGWLARAPMEWGEHVAIGKRSAGLTEAEILRVQEGPAAEGWSDHDRALLQAVDDLMLDAMISDDTWERLARTQDERQCVELMLLVGHYRSTACLQNSLRIRLRDGNNGLFAR